MSRECKYFYEDEVYRITKKGHLEFGMVLRNADVDSDEESDAEEIEKLKNGHIMVAWHPRGDEEVIPERKVGLSDRCLMPGDIVRRLVPGRDTQRGYCRTVTMKAAVLVVGTKQVIFNVPSEKLTPLEEFAPDIAVCLDAWVGMINSVTSEVQLRFPDGSSCILSDEEASELDDPSGRRMTDTEFRVWFYPGQILQGPIKAMERAQWLTCNKETQALRDRKAKMVKVTVSAYRVTSLNVHWQCRAVTAEGSLDQPPHIISGEELKRVRMLNVLEPCTLQLGDMNTYQLDADDLVMSLDQWKKLEKEMLKAGKAAFNATATSKPPAVSKGSANPPAENTVEGATGGVAAAPHLQLDVDDEMGSVSSYSSMGSAGKRPRRNCPSLKTHIMKKRKLKRSRPCRPPVGPVISLTPGDRLVVETLKTVSWVSVVWQDGTVEEDVPSVNLHPSHHLDEHEFFPGDYVVEQKGRLGPSDEYGVVQRVDHAGRTAQIHWYQIYIHSNQIRPQYLRKTEASVYDLSDHPDFRYRPGTVVISVSPHARGGVAAANNRTASANTTTEAVNNAANVAAANNATLDTETASNCLPNTIEAAISNATESVGSDPPDSVPQPPEAPPPDGGHAPSQQTPPPGCAHAGQVLDVLTSGEVKVWWADGTITNCYPQDLFRVGEYDSDEGELWDNTADSADSTEWETQSEESVPGAENSADHDPSPDEKLKPKLAAIIEKVRVTLSRLEEIFTQNAALQSPLVMRQLLDIYKNARCLDKLMETSFFEESHFSGLVAQIRERSRAFTAQKELTAPCRLPDTSAPGGQNQNQEGNSGGAGGGDGVSAPAEKTPGMNECARFCSMIKAQLLLAYQEVVRRYGLSLGAVDLKTNGDVTSDDVTGDADSSQPVTNGDLPSPTCTSPTHDPDEETELVTSDRSKVTDLTEATPTAGDDPPCQPGEGFSTLPTVPDSHKFKVSLFQPVDSASFLRAVRREATVLSRSLPQGIVVKGYDERMDLYSVMVKGPCHTPYEDGLFFFDVQLSPEYPRTPPIFHYISYCQDRLNPNLYEDGKVCVSLLGTWGGRGTEVWSAKSSLLQVLVSIQGLILVAEPYYNEAGYEKQRGSQQATENSRLYNEMVILKLVQSLTEILKHPPSVFVTEVHQHLRTAANRLIGRLQNWLRLSETGSAPSTDGPEAACAGGGENGGAVSEKPDFPLFPVSRGFCLTLNKTLTAFQQALETSGLLEETSGGDTTKPAEGVADGR